MLLAGPGPLKATEAPESYFKLGLPLGPPRPRAGSASSPSQAEEGTCWELTLSLTPRAAGPPALSLEEAEHSTNYFNDWK